MAEVISYPSPNFGPRRHGGDPELVVLHYTAMEKCSDALARLCDPAAEVSSHYLISETGQIFQLVDEEMRAWHAGAGAWGAVTDLNSYSIGIELANSGPLGDFPPFPEAQFSALEELLSEVLARWGIAPERVIAHSDMAPTRKLDPGAKFNWQRLARQGLSVWCDVSEKEKTIDWGVFIKDAARVGYVLPNKSECEDPAGSVLAAFRLRFAPHREGALSSEDMEQIGALAATYPASSSIDPVLKKT